MLKFKDVSQEQTGEVVRRAAEMQMRDEEETQVKDATVSAAEEMGISQDYLEKAAQEVQARKINEVRAKRRRNQIIGGGVAAVAAVGAIAFFTRPPAPFALGQGVPVVVAQRISPGTQATVIPAPGGATINVQRFGDGQYFANAELTGPTSVAGYRNMTFTVSGTGNLPGVRIDLEGGNNARWKGPVVPVSPNPQKVTVNMDQFQLQLRKNGQWEKSGGGRPGPVEKITIKAGDTINLPDSSGSVTVRDITFE